MISYDIYVFHYYSLESLLNRLSDLKVEVKKYYKYSDYRYYLKIRRKYRKIIGDNFNDYVIDGKFGLINFFERLILKPTTLIASILAICLFLNLSKRIYKVELSGDFPLIEGELIEFLKLNEIKKFTYGVNEGQLQKIEIELKEKFSDRLEFVELRKEGGVVSLNYKKRRKELVIEGKKGSLYASKDGVIKGFSLLSGVKNVKLYDFVKKGDLLVSDILITSGNENIVIGTLGSVYASTFYYIEVKTDLILDEVSMYSYLLDKARVEVSKNINSDEEYIESEKVLISDLKSGYLKVYYVLYEDITI